MVFGNTTIRVIEKVTILSPPQRNKREGETPPKEREDAYRGVKDVIGDKGRPLVTVHEVEHTTNYYPPPYPILVTYQRENPITTSTPESNIPDTVNELLQQNSQPIPPEELFEKVKELNPGDQQVFSWNIVNQLVRFHEFVIEDMDCNDPSYTTWVGDLEKLRMCSLLLDSLSS